MTTVDSYAETLGSLSGASVRKHFDAFEDIAWDSPEYAIDKSDPRWVLSTIDPIGRHPWYRALPLGRQIEIGLWRQANICKVGLQFENVLIRGLMEYVNTLPNGSPEFRYCTHEATEETHHTQMFQEFVNRSGADVPGGRLLFRVLAPFLPLAARVVPEIFFVGVLAGEEPIDHVQKQALRSSEEIHPLYERIMQIHVAEEARHISFAHEYLRQTVPRLNTLRRALLSVALPIIMRVLCDVILIPGKQMTRDVGVPRAVIRDVYWDAPESRVALRDLFGDVRMLAEEIDVMNPVSRLLWKAMKINGRPSRYRGAPAAA